MLQLGKRLTLFMVFLMSLSACTDKQTTDSQLASATSGASYSLLRAGNRYAGPTGDPYLDDVQNVLGKRCAVCHSCTNGPCQLNMTSYDALRRGISSINPYEFGLKEKFSTRVSDNRSLSYWRDLGFRSVLPESGQAPETSIFFRSIDTGKRNGQAENAGTLSLGLARELAKIHDAGSYTCPATDKEYDQFVSKGKPIGMPWAMPSVENSEHNILEQWVLAGSPGPEAAARKLISEPEATRMSKTDPQELVQEWENFLNEDKLEAQLVARYIYEHSYQANIELSENPGEYYRIVRSRTGSYEPLDRIVTDGPMDDPAVKRVYYRLEKNNRLIEGKSHILWNLSRQSLETFRQNFYAKPWKLARLPGYTSLNPFEIFEAIPAPSRSRFMLENSKMIYQSFARGPICMIQGASYVADEYYWLWFMKPESDPSVLDPKLGLDSYKTFFNKDGNIASGIPVLGDKYGEPTYRNAFEKTLRRLKPQGLGLEDVWLGEGQNPNAWLVYNRHQNSAEFTTAADRPISGLPRSVWLVSYANFERMYYNATVQYRYWGNLRHQNDSFNWQTYARTEAEDLYVSMFSEQNLRDNLRNRYTTFKGKVYNKLFTDYARGRPAKDKWTSEDQLMRAVYQSMGPGVIVREDRLNNWPYDKLSKDLTAEINSLDKWESGLRTLTARAAPFTRFVPNVVHVRVTGEHLYTILANRGYHTDKMAAIEADSRAPERDQIMIVPGFAAFESHLFIDLDWQDARGFIQDLSQITNQSDWNRFHDRYAIARNSSRFWPFVDWMHGWLESNMPSEAGLLELRFYDKDEKPF